MGIFDIKCSKCGNKHSFLKTTLLLHSSTFQPFLYCPMCEGERGKTKEQLEIEADRFYTEYVRDERGF